MDRRGQRVVDDSFVLLFNAHDDAVPFLLPDEEYGQGWTVVVDTAGVSSSFDAVAPGSDLKVAGKSLVVLQALVPEQLKVITTPPAAAVPGVPAAPRPTSSASAGGELAQVTVTGPHE